MRDALVCPKTTSSFFRCVATEWRTITRGSGVAFFSILSIEAFGSSMLWPDKIHPPTAKVIAAAIR